MFGYLLVGLGKYEKSETYFRNILRSKPNNEQVACLFYNMGLSYCLKRDYQRSFDSYERAYNMHLNTRPIRLVSAAKTLNGMGVVYSEQENYIKAIEYFELALKIYKKYLQHRHADIGGTLTNLGNVYLEQGKYDRAAEYFKKAQKLTNHTSQSSKYGIDIKQFGYNLFW
ncbi:unnamed protein product [Didymodactylos carnosus]|uniref:Uncharacterized protein n=1 Tax=Didymodactylos carnosus TaxID=1234261 RepID=A0A814Q0E3_9BILA|nr:unnamed protein product [Didymodactylos carnosus]CAF3877702.1 unnamed protein product [Didymodactylos carnosus]